MPSWKPAQTERRSCFAIVGYTQATTSLYDGKQYAISATLLWRRSRETLLRGNKYPARPSRDCVHHRRLCARLFITSDAFAETAATLLGQTPTLETRLMVGEPSPAYESWKSAIAAMPSVPISDEVQGLDMLYSSGTTGQPKGIKWPMPGVKPGEPIMLIERLTSLYGYCAQTRYLSPAPLYHAAPLRHSMTVLRLGGTVHIMQRFDAEATLQIIENERINTAQWVPTMFVRMLNLPTETRERYDYSSLKMVLHAAVPCPIPIKEQMLSWWGPIINEYYAGTENNGFCNISSAEWLEHKGLVGRAMLGEIHICNDAGEELPVGEQGTVYFASGHLFEYYNAPDKTAASRNTNSWSTLGDIGRIDDEGYPYLTDRKAFVIISGGVNIYPQESENILMNHPQVMGAAVFGIPNEDLGEEVKAAVQLIEMTNAGPELSKELIDHCQSQLASY